VVVDPLSGDLVSVDADGELEEARDAVDSVGVELFDLLFLFYFLALIFCLIEKLLKGVDAALIVSEHAEEETCKHLRRRLRLAPLPLLGREEALADDDSAEVFHHVLELGQFESQTCIQIAVVLQQALNLFVDFFRKEEDLV